MDPRLSLVLWAVGIFGAAVLYLWVFIDCAACEEPPSRRVNWLLALLLFNYLAVLAYLCKREHRRRMRRALINWWHTGVPSAGQPDQRSSDAAEAENDS